MEKEDVFSRMATKWASAIVARQHIETFSGGILTPKYLANLDSLGEGPPSIRIGQKVAYPVAELVQWLRGRTVVVTKLNRPLES